VKPFNPKTKSRG